MNPNAETNPQSSPAGAPQAPHDSGETNSSRDERTPDPRLPHERDESASDQEAGEASQAAVGQIALADQCSEKTNTDRSSESDATYNRNFDRDSAEPPRR